MRTLLHALAVLAWCACAGQAAAPRRIVLIKADGLPGDVVERWAAKTDPKTGRSPLPWIDHVFFQHGARLRNFYVRGISLSAPAWSMLDSGRHLVIRGNAEFDRATLRIYDYLNFFPFYVGNARTLRADMPSVEVLDEAGIPLLLDRYPRERRYLGPQLFQRGVTWKTLAAGAKNRFTSRSVRQLFDEWQTGFSFAAAVNEQVEREIRQRIAGETADYIDYFFTDYDHVAHLANDEESIGEVLERLDALIGRLWTAIEESPRARDTVLVLVSDHGMNSDPSVYSQGFNLIRLFNSAEGGGHHVITNRYPLTEYQLKGLDPFVNEVLSPSSQSQYLANEAAQYPTALLDLDGNERASIHLRNNTLNQLHILLQQIARAPTALEVPAEARRQVFAIIERHRARWSETVSEIDAELEALTRFLHAQRQRVAEARRNVKRMKKRGGSEDALARERYLLVSVEQDLRGYREYAAALRRLLALGESDLEPGRFEIQQIIPRRTMGEPNTVRDLANYITGPGSSVNYFTLLTSLRVRNNVQQGVESRPIDFVAVPLDPRHAGEDADTAVFLYAGPDRQAILLARGGREMRLIPSARLEQGADGSLKYEKRDWGPGLPLHLFEDANLAVEGSRAAWLGEWHSAADWLAATHRTQYSNAVTGLAEHFSPIELGENSIAWRDAGSDTGLLRRFHARKRRMVQADMLVLASSHWNFNVRGFNPGGNHGSFFRVSTLSTLMAAGSGIPAARVIDRPYDSLSFFPTVLRLAGLASEVQAGEYPGPVIEELLR